MAFRLFTHIIRSPIFLLEIQLLTQIFILYTNFTFTNMSTEIKSVIIAGVKL